jgi:hypothetical protein
MGRYSIREEIRGLDPERDCQRICYLDSTFEFPFDMTRSLEFALFRTFASERVSSLLQRTGEFTERPQKRYDDTDLIISEIYINGYESERGLAAIRRMNQQHGRFEIPAEEMRYVLSTFVLEPIRWVERFGWRPMEAVEKQAQFAFWRQVGRRMNIADIPETLEALEAFNRAYEAEHFRYAPSNQRVAESVREMFIGWLLPRPLHALGRPFVHALMDDRLLAACGFPSVSPAWRAFVEAGIRLRARALRHFPPRRRPMLRTELKRKKTYPDGWVLEKLGPDGT